MSQEMIVGERRAAPGTDPDFRGGPYAELIVNDGGLGRYFEAVRAGRMFTTMVKAVTIAATHNSPIAVNTATPVAAIWNRSTNKAGVLTRVGIVTTSGTPAGGQVVLNYQPNVTAITAAITGSIFNHDGRVGASPQGSVMRVMNNVALAGWLATPDAVQELAIIGGAAAAAAAGNGGSGLIGEDFGGMFILPPGGLWAIMAGSGAGTSWIVNASLTWVEVDWPL
jgi:hypothetical protein